MLNYNPLDVGRDTWSKNDVGDSTASPPGTPKLKLPIWMVLLFLFLNVGLVSAQLVNTYSFAQSTGTYTPIAGGTVLGSGTTAATDDVIYSITLPFDFAFNNVAYTSGSTMRISTNGFLTFGATAPTGTTYTPLSSSTAYAGAIAAVGGDLSGSLISGNLGELRYETIGTAPNRTLVVQWKNYIRYVSAYQTTDVVNFQIRLSETSNSISFIYDTFTISSSSSSPQVGLRGATNSVYLNRTTSTNWAASTAGTANNSTMSLTTSVRPTSGLTFTFAPPVPCNAAPAIGTVTPSSQTLCPTIVPGAITVSGFGGISGLSYAWEESTNGGSSWGPATGGSGASTATYTPPAFAGTAILYRALVTCAAVSLSTPSASASVGPQAPPTTAASNVTFAPTLSNAAINWTNGNGGRRYVVVNTTNSFTDPVGTAPVTVAGTAYTSGEQIVYDGTGSSVTITGLVNGTTYYARVYEYNRCAGTPTVNYYNVNTATNNPNSFQYINNDACANAITLNSCSGAPQTLNGSTTNSTVDPYLDCGATGDVNSQRGVWYRYVGDNSNVTINTCNATGYDSRLTVYSGACGSFTCVGGNDDMSAALCPASGLRSEVNFNAYAGTDYYIFVHGYQSGTSLSATGNFVLNWTCTALCTPIATNDECADATSVTVGTPLVSNNTCATASLGVTYPSCTASQFSTHYDTWYSFNSGSNTTLEVSTVAVSPAIVGYALYSGTCGTLTQVACSATGAAANVTLTADTVYYVRAWSDAAGERGDFTLSVKVPCLVPTAVTAVDVQPTTAEITWTASASSPSNGYEYAVTELPTPPPSGTDTTMGTSASLDDLISGTLYYFHVRSVCAVEDYSPWVTISFKFLEGNSCATAIDLATLVSPYSGDTTGASNDFTNACSGNTSPDLIFYIDVPAGYSLVIGQPSNSYDSENNVAWGGACPGENVIACYDDPDVQDVTWQNTTGETQRVYWIQDGFFDSTTFGAFVLAWSLNPPPVVVSSFDPTSVCGQDGGAEIVITGSNFVDVSSVQFNGIEAASFNVDSATQITAVLPAGDTSGVITVYSTPSSNGSASSADPLTVNPNPTVEEIVPAEAAVLCVGGDTAQYSSASPGGTWSTGNPLIATVDANGEVTAVGAGETNVIYTVTLGTGCSTSVSRSVIVNEPINITDHPDGIAVVTNDPASFSVVATGSVANAEWRVSTDGGFVFDPLTIAPPYSTSYDSFTNTYTLSISAAEESMNGNYYQLFLDAADPCTDSESFGALLNVGNTGIQTQPSPVTLCSTGSGETEFTVVASGPVDSYQWYVNWGFGPTPITSGTDDFDPEVSYVGFNDATLQVSGLNTDNSGWFYSVDVVGPLNTVTSNEVLLTVNEGIVINDQPSADQTCSSGGSTILSVGYTGTVSNVQWQYSSSASGPFANVANGTPAGFTYAAAGNDLTITNAAGSAVATHYYRAVLDASAPCADLESDPAALSVTQPTIGVSPASASYCTPGPGVTLTASGGVSYSWSPSEGLDTTSGAVVVASPSSTTTYIVTGVDALGCSSTTSVTVTVGASLTANAFASAEEVCAGGSVTLNSGVVATLVPGPISQYAFSTGSSPYADLVGSTAVAMNTEVGDTAVDDNYSALHPIGFTFNFGGAAVDNFAISTNGYLRLGAAITEDYDVNQLDGPDSNVIMFNNRDLNNVGAVYSYKLDGSAPNRILKVEAKNFYRYDTSTHTGNAQVWLYEGTNKVEIRYGAYSSTWTSGTVRVGLRGTSNAQVRAVNSTTWAGVTAASVSTSTSAGITQATTNQVVSGTMFTFVPGNTPSYTYEWTSNPAGFTSTEATPTVNPSEMTTYFVTVTSAAGCTTSSSVVVNTVSGATIETQPIASAICEGQSLSLSVEASGPGLTYQWRRNGNNVGVNSPTYTVASATLADSGSYDVVVTPACGPSATSDAVTVAVNPTPTVIAPGSATYCAGTEVPSVALTGTPVGVTYNISGGSGIGLADQMGVTSVPSFTAAYGVAIITVTPMANGCTGTPVTYTITVNDTPSTVTATPETSSVCSNDPAVLLTATGGIGGRNASLGTQTTTTSSTAITPFSNLWEGTRRQYLIRASEMTAAGFAAGTIQSLGFNVTSNTGVIPMSNFTVSIGATTTTALVSGTYDSAVLTTVYMNASEPAPSVGPKVFPFSSGFVWDGTSNIIVEICHQNDLTDAGDIYDSNATVSATTTTFTSVTARYADDTEMCGTTNGSSTSSSTRPLFTFGMTNQQFPIIWSPVEGLYTDAAATVPYTGTNSATVYAKPAAGTATFTATAQGVGSCSSNDTVQVTLTTAQDWYVDADGDGYGELDSPVAYTGCAQPGYATNNTDCNDSVAAVNPGVTEIAYNGVDDNCNGTIDEGSQVFSQVLPSQCGTTLANIGSLVGLVSVPGATAYRIEVTNTETSAVQEIVRYVSNFSFTHLPVYDYAATYSIRVMVQRNGIWLNYYGNSCLVSTPAVTDPDGAAQVNPSQCGVTLASLNTLIATTSLAGVAQYRFRVTDLTDGDGPNMVQIIDRPLHWFSLKMLTRYNYGTTYSIEVAVRTTGSTTFTGFGAPCNVTTPAVPQIAMCGQTIATAGTNVYTTSLNSVTSYRFVITNFNDFTVTTLDRPLHWFNFTMIPGYEPGATYGVAVAVMTSGEWSPFSDGCEIVAPGGARPSVKETTLPFNAIAYPNPFADTFGIELTTSAESNVNVKVYDMTGRMLEQKDVPVTDMQTLQVGERYPAGVYNVIVTQGDQAKTLRVIKR